MEALVRAKPELIKEADHHGRTPLYYAASMGDRRTVQRLLQLHTDIVYMSDQDGLSPLHVAASRGHTNIIKEIIQCCPDSGELLDLRGQNTLHFAVLGGKSSVVRYILETTELEGLINQTDNDGNTPLHLATRERKSWIARYLIWDERVDQRAKNNIGQTAIDYEESIRKAYSRFPKKSKNWRQPWSLNKWTTKEKIPPSTSEEGAAADKMETYKQMGHTLLMVATLIATVTFAAAFTIPGGFNNIVGPDQGQALLQSSLHLKWFLVTDSIAMSFSVIAACILFWGAVIAEETYFYYFASATALTHVALFSTGVAFTTGLIAIMPNQPFQQCLLAQPNLDRDKPLHVAASAGCISIVDLGLACLENNTGESPLHLAARDGMQLLCITCCCISGTSGTHIFELMECVHVGFRAVDVPERPGRDEFRSVHLGSLQFRTLNLSRFLI
ncbi:hypothetical protein HYC85_014746 [Camellia sinensis]|uniref:PGG domain-containing protein n=1 Tax=Camellia sinensis TaxID=4442 RepID=A0A7J7H7D3_CAMSI|nr:hypothetical protein HYC85_014746 [Camellia sinensis]